MKEGFLSLSLWEPLLCNKRNICTRAVALRFVLLCIKCSHQPAGNTYHVFIVQWLLSWWGNKACPCILRPGSSFLTLLWRMTKRSNFAAFMKHSSGLAPVPSQEEGSPWLPGVSLGTWEFLTTFLLKSNNCCAVHGAFIPFWLGTHLQQCWP